MERKSNIFVVDDEKKEKEFLSLPLHIYKESPNYIHPINEDISQVFDPNKNKFFKHGKCIRWILRNEEGVTIGRVAAFVDKNILKSYDQPTGGLGFFECIDDEKAAFTLFDTCKEWLKEQGMEAMDGPINFGARLQWWGLMVSGDYKPVYGMFYHQRYYRKFFENYGFKDFFQQYNYQMTLEKENLNRIVLLKAKRVYRDKKFSTKFFDKKNADKFIKDFTTIYNNTWIGDIPGVDRMTEAEVRETFEGMKPILEEKYIIFAYYDDEPIGFFLMIPDANEIIQYGKGKFTLSLKLRFLWYKYFQKNKTVVGQIFGVDKAYQGRGVEAIMIEKFSQVIFPGNEPFKYLQFNWIGDFNPRMQHLLEEHLNAKIIKTYITYRYLFDRNKPFKRAEKVGQ